MSASVSSDGRGPQITEGRVESIRSEGEVGVRRLAVTSDESG